MKEILNEHQLIIIAKDEIEKLFKTIPSLSNVIIKSNKGIQGDSFDLIVSFNIKETFFTLYVETKMRGEKRFVQNYIEEIKHRNIEANYMFIAPFISVDSAEMLKACGINYMDLSGNCYLSIDGVYISVQGNSNQYISTRSNKNIFAKTSVKSAMVLKTMLNSPYHEWQVQELAWLSGASLGLISAIKKYLIENKWAERIRNRFCLNNFQDLIWEWAKVYNKRLFPSEEYYTLDRIAEFESNLFEWNKKRGARATLGAFSAAARYAPSVRYNKSFVYLEMAEKQRLIDDFGLEKVQSGGNIVICSEYEDTTTMFSREINNSLVTSPVQTILDLLSHAGRGEEAAEMIIRKEFSK